MFHAYGKAISRTALHRHRQSASWGACGRPPRPTRSRELPLAVPGKLTEICGALDLGIAPAAACALSMSTAPAGLGPPAMLMLVRTRMRVAMARSCWRCRAGLCFHAMLPARPHCHAYYELPCILYGDVGVTRSVKISTWPLPCRYGPSEYGIGLSRGPDKESPLNKLQVVNAKKRANQVKDSDGKVITDDIDKAAREGQNIEVLIKCTHLTHI